MDMIHTLAAELTLFLGFIMPRLTFLTFPLFSTARGLGETGRGQTDNSIGEIPSSIGKFPD
jgi:hypothetical protein